MSNCSIYTSHSCTETSFGSFGWEEEDEKDSASISSMSSSSTECPDVLWGYDSDHGEEEEEEDAATIEDDWVE